jgi:hypothetical protein
VAGRAEQLRLTKRPSRQGLKAAARCMKARSRHSLEKISIGIEQQLAPEFTAKQQTLARNSLKLRAIQMRRTQLNQGMSVLQKTCEMLKECLRGRCRTGYRQEIWQLQTPYDCAVGCGKVDQVQSVGRHPAQWLSFAPHRHARKSSHSAHVQQNLLVAIVVANAAQGLLPKGCDAKLFFQLADQRRLHSFPRLTLASGKLPKSTLMGLGRTQSNQDLPGRILNHSYGDMHNWWHWLFLVSVERQLR